MPNIKVTDLPYPTSQSLLLSLPLVHSHSVTCSDIDLPSTNTPHRYSLWLTSYPSPRQRASIAPRDMYLLLLFSSDSHAWFSFHACIPLTSRQRTPIAQRDSTLLHLSLHLTSIIPVTPTHFLLFFLLLNLQAKDLCRRKRLSTAMTPTAKEKLTSLIFKPCVAITPWCFIQVDYTASTSHHHH